MDSYFVQVGWKEVKALSNGLFCLKGPGELKENLNAARGWRALGRVQEQGSP